MALQTGQNACQSFKNVKATANVAVKLFEMEFWHMPLRCKCVVVSVLR